MATLADWGMTAIRGMGIAVTCGDGERENPMPLVEIADIHAADAIVGSFRAGALDAPTTGTNVDRDIFQVDGWILGRDQPVIAVTVADEVGEIHRFPVGVARADIAAAYPDAPAAGGSGFQDLVSTVGLPAEFTLTLRGVLADGSAHVLATIRGRRRFLSPLSPPLPRPTITADDRGTPEEEETSAWPQLACDGLANGAELLPDWTVGGWVFSPVGIKSVSLWLDGEELGLAELAIERPDVARDRPEWPAAPRAGFLFRGRDLPVAPLPRTAEFIIVAEDWLGRRVAVRRSVRLVEHPPKVEGSFDIPLVRALSDPLREAGWSSPLVVYGWAMDPAGIERVEVLVDGEVVAEAERGVPREDVESQRGEFRRLGLAANAGWLAVVPLVGVITGQHLVSAIVHGISGTLQLESKPVWLRAESVRADPERRRRLTALLRCPACGGELRDDGETARCLACGKPIPGNEFGTLLLDETYAGLDWRKAVATSHTYTPEAAQVVLDCADGLVLDIGAGLRENLPHVIQLDAIAFPTTDVAANAEVLPFADESFDGVIASNLLEHVSNPAAVVAEMRRVCKRGGRIYADFTSVHPYHGFPHHYFNATETGLAWLMREVGGAEGRVESAAGHISVWLVLHAWLGSLGDVKTRERLRAMPVAELLDLLGRGPHDPELGAALASIYPGGRRLVPPKVVFDGVRAR